MGSGQIVSFRQASGSILEWAQSSGRDVMWVERSRCREESNPGCKRASPDALGSDERGAILGDYQERYIKNIKPEWTRKVGRKWTSTNGRVRHSWKGPP